jgi:hypothetical protein
LKSFIRTDKKEEKKETFLVRGGLVKADQTKGVELEDILRPSQGQYGCQCINWPPGSTQSAVLDLLAAGDLAAYQGAATGHHHQLAQHHHHHKLHQVDMLERAVAAATAAPPHLIPVTTLMIPAPGPPHQPHGATSPPHQHHSFHAAHAHAHHHHHLAAAAAHNPLFAAAAAAAAMSQHQQQQQLVKHDFTVNGTAAGVIPLAKSPNNNSPTSSSNSSNSSMASNNGGNKPGKNKIESGKKYTVNLMHLLAVRKVRVIARNKKVIRGNKKKTKMQINEQYYWYTYWQREKPGNILTQKKKKITCTC